MSATYNARRVRAPPAGQPSSAVLVDTSSRLVGHNDEQVQYERTHQNAAKLVGAPRRNEIVSYPGLGITIDDRRRDDEQRYELACVEVPATPLTRAPLGTALSPALPVVRDTRRPLPAASVPVALQRDRWTKYARFQVPLSRSSRVPPPVQPSGTATGSADQGDDRLDARADANDKIVRFMQNFNRNTMRTLKPSWKHVDAGELRRRIQRVAIVAAFKQMLNAANRTKLFAGTQSVRLGDKFDNYEEAMQNELFDIVRNGTNTLELQDIRKQLLDGTAPVHFDPRYLLEPRLAPLHAPFVDLVAQGVLAVNEFLLRNIAPSAGATPEQKEELQRTQRGIMLLRDDQFVSHASLFQSAVPHATARFLSARNNGFRIATSARFAISLQNAISKDLGFVSARAELRKQMANVKDRDQPWFDKAILQDERVEELT